MKIPVTKIFQYSLIFIAIIALVLVIASKMPANSLLYDCQQNANSPLSGLPVTSGEPQRFCQTGYHPEVKATLGDANSYVADGLILLAGFITLPAGVILLSRRFHSMSV
jgi:hypothetical protein